MNLNEKIFPDYVYKSIKEYKNTVLPVSIVKSIGLDSCAKHLSECFKKNIKIRLAFYEANKWQFTEDKEYYIAELTKI